jgi:hypothetical protein
MKNAFPQIPSGGPRDCQLAPRSLHCPSILASKLTSHPKMETRLEVRIPITRDLAGNSTSDLDLLGWYKRRRSGIRSLYGAGVAGTQTVE